MSVAIWSGDGPTNVIGVRWLLGLTRKGQVLDHDTPGTIEAAVQRVLKKTTRDHLDGRRLSRASWLASLTAAVDLEPVA